MTSPRPLRRAVCALVAATALLLTGCTDDDGADRRPAGTDGTPSGGASAPAEGLPAASGDFGDAPELSFPDDAPPAGLQVQVLSEGDGDVVEAGAAVAADYVGHVWGEDAPFDESYTRGKPALFSLNSVLPGWSQGIPEHTVGSRLLVSIPPELGYGPQGGNEGAGIGPDDTIVFVLDLVEVYNPSATGEAEATVVADPAELPVTIAGDPGTPATFTVNAGVTEPTEPGLIRITEGTGEPVAAGQQVAVAFVATYWDNTGTESSWAPGEGGPGGPLVANMGAGTVFDLALGVPVGSRVLLSAPGEADGPALVVLVDILGSV